MDGMAVEASATESHACVETKTNGQLIKVAMNLCLIQSRYQVFIRMFAINRILNDYIDTIVGDDPTIDEIIYILDKLCNVFKN